MSMGFDLFTCSLLPTLRKNHCSHATWPHVYSTITILMRYKILSDVVMASVLRSYSWDFSDNEHVGVIVRVTHNSEFTMENKFVIKNNEMHKLWRYRFNVSNNASIIIFCFHIQILIDTMIRWCISNMNIIIVVAWRPMWRESALKLIYIHDIQWPGWHGDVKIVTTAHISIP